MEATLQDGDTLYGWYHWEPHAEDVCAAFPKTAPQIGALVSHDNGVHWKDLGIVLRAPEGDLHCDTPNGYFAGGHGDFSVLPDREREQVYFFFDNYGGPAETQGVCIGRMSFADLDDPVGKVWKWHAGQWSEPGLDGRMTPFLPVAQDWHAEDVDAFWGPSIHWNTHLEQYVILLNRAIDPAWGQEGIYITGNRDISDPAGWSQPERLPLELEGPIHMQFYPQIFGVNAQARETDKLAGAEARLFVAGVSRWMIRFGR